MHMPAKQNEFLKTFRGVFYRTVEIYRDRFWTIAWILLFIYVPINALIEFSPWFRDPEDFDGMIQLAQLTGFYEILIGSFAMILLILLARNALSKKSATLSILVSKEFTISHYGRYVWTVLLKNIALAVLFVLLFVPGVVAGVFWLFAEPIAVLEGKGGLEAFRRSYRQLRGKWWQAFGMILLAIAVVLFPINVIAGLLASYSDLSAVRFLGSTLVDFGRAFFVIFVTVYYLQIQNS